MAGKNFLANGIPWRVRRAGDRSHPPLDGYVPNVGCLSAPRRRAPSDLRDVVIAAAAAATGLFAPAISSRDPVGGVAESWAGRCHPAALLLLLSSASRRGEAHHGRCGVARSTGYLAYTGAAFAYAFNELFLVYVALFALTGAALIAALSGIDVADLREAFDEARPGAA